MRLPVVEVALIVLGWTLDLLPVHLTSPEAAVDPDPFYLEQFPDFSSALPGQLRVLHGL